MHRHFWLSLLIFLFFMLGHSDSLRSCPDTVRRITDYSIENRAVSSHHRASYVLDPEIWLRYFVVLKVGESIKLFNLVQSWDLIFSLSPHSIPFKNSDVEITAMNESLKMLKCSSDTSCAGERIIHEISRLDLTLVCHQESQLVVSRSWSQIRSLLQVIFRIVSVIIFITAISDSLPEVKLPVRLVVKNSITNIKFF